jgi:hypothetical protein
MQTCRIALVGAVIAASFTVSTLAQMPHPAHKQGVTAPPLNNQFNLRAYSPSLMPYSPPLGSPMQRGAPVQSQPPHQVHSQPIRPIAYFCPQLGGYFPAIQHCPTEWVRVNPAYEHRWR